MAKIQKRRSISVRRDTYRRVRAQCESNAISMSNFVEKAIAAAFGETYEMPGPTARPPRLAALKAAAEGRPPPEYRRAPVPGARRQAKPTPQAKRAAWPGRPVVPGLAAAVSKVAPDGADDPARSGRTAPAAKPAPVRTMPDPWSRS